MLGTVPKASVDYSHLVLISALGDRFYNDPSFTDEETETGIPEF